MTFSQLVNAMCDVMNKGIYFCEATYNMIVNNTLILVFVLVFFFIFCIGLIKRLMRL